MGEATVIGGSNLNLGELPNTPRSAWSAPPAPPELGSNDAGNGKRQPTSWLDALCVSDFEHLDRGP